MKHFAAACALAIAPLAAVAIGGAMASPPRAAPAHDLSAFVGRWQIDPARTHMGRNGPNGENILRSQTFTFAFTPEGKGLKMDVYASYPQPKPSHSMLLVADEKSWTCPGPESCMTKGGVASEQTYRWYSLDPHFLARLFFIKGQAYDYSTLNVSSDGQTMTLISWDPATPQYQNIQVFEKQQ